ncbi:hypothetical protein GYMLUDRAFT_248305 [Collybiopsis luxurians FD-317 M1]|uniref:Uncharacterized protein n=1 Tax=Collybiopsis luxurians FD-317 M1 TaxID=944289 RepID=A0A0D0BM42_9AGAR|nr:hypothetical protein GYMLUDRAFT_248305 [Collybiopsis luxurians FD-317 M1]
MSHKEFVSLMELLLEEMLGSPFVTDPSQILSWGNLLSPNHAVVTCWPTFDDLYSYDILLYAKLVQAEAAYCTPQMVQTVLDIFCEELQHICIATQKLPHSQLGKKSIEQIFK